MAENVNVTVLSGANDQEKLEDLCSRSFKDQAVWFLNAFWEDFGAQEAEQLWRYVEIANETDINNNGVLDEFEGHKFLEKCKEEMTVMAMRQKLRDTGAINKNDRPKTVPICHFLLFRYDVDWTVLVNAPQGSKEEIDKAQAMLDEVQRAFEASEAAAAAAAEALRQSKAAEAEAKAREAEAIRTEDAAKAREAEAKEREADAVAREHEARAIAEDAREKEAEFKAAEEEVAAAVAELKAQEDAYNSKIEELKKRSTEGGVVSQGKAKNELAQLLAEDPLPLRRAKITMEAALKRAEKARAPFKEATEKAEAAAKLAGEARAAAEAAANQASQARAEAGEAAREASQARSLAEQARSRSEDAKRAADAALEEASAKLQEAEEYLEEAKNRMPNGSIWWMERELHERRAYMPQKMGGYKK